jgi:AcrR family transcriptional regulator
VSHQWLCCRHGGVTARPAQAAHGRGDRGRRPRAVRGSRLRADDRRPDRGRGRHLRRTFFRYFADKEELFFAEDERLLEVIRETLDEAPAGEPVLELARRATRALAAHSAADPERRLARERLIAATPALQARRMAKTLRWEEAIAARLVARGSSEEEALLVPKLALACFQTAYQRWVRTPGQDLPGLVDDGFAALARLTG